MCLSSLADLKIHLGLGTTTAGEDARLTRFLRAATFAVRSHCGRYLGGNISANTLANPTVVTSIGHGLATGDVIVIAGSNSTPTIDGAQTVTRVSDDTFTVPVNCTAAGTAGWYARTYAEVCRGNGRETLLLRERPIISVTSVHEDSGAYFGAASSPWASTTALTAGTDYAVASAQGGTLHRIGGAWPAGARFSGGTLVAEKVPAAGNIRVIYTAGYSPLPFDITDAVCNVAAEMMSAAKRGGPLASESLDYYSYQRAAGDILANSMASTRKLLGKYREVAI